jgi:thioredoxin 2
MIRKCPSCGKSNRVPPARLADTGRCGSCKAELAPLAEPIDADPETFDSVIAAARVPVLVDFWAAWCGPCRMAAPEVKKVAAQMAGSAIVLKVDTEKWPILSERFKIMSIPNFAVFKDRKLVFQQPGLVDHRQLAAWLQKAA